MMKTRGMLLALLCGATPVACSDVEDVELRTWIDADADLPIVNPSEVDGRVEAIEVQFDTLALHHVELGWIDMQTSVGFIDLLDPEILPKMIVTTRFPSGSYDRIRFEVVQAFVVVDGTRMPLRIRSGPEPEVVVDVFFCLERGRVASLDLNWAVTDALHWTRRGGWWMEAAIDVADPPRCGGDPV
jgi:hypothetical protein